MFHEAVVEFHAFQSNSNEFILKELAIVSDWSVTVIVFSAPYSKCKLNCKMIKTANWLEKHYHGIPWSQKGVTFSTKMMKTLLIPFDIIHTKGLEKFKFLSRFHNNVHEISFDTNKAKYSGCLHNCILAQHHDVSYNCALRNATQFFGDLRQNKSCWKIGSVALEPSLRMDAWELISRESKRPLGVLSDDFILKYDKYLNFDLLSENYHFSVELLRTYSHRVNWFKILKRQKFNVSFLREMAIVFDDQCWIAISRFQELPESFIHDFADKLDWEYIVLYQSVSDRFVNDHKGHFV